MSDLKEVLNWRRINGSITTSGQPTEAQLSDIKALGVTHIVILGPHSNKGALDDEAASVAALGMTYVYIPVDFGNPTEADYVKFRKALDGLSDTKVHVHCIYNARVSAFFYRLGKSGWDKSEVELKDSMDGIWRPGGVWATFIGDDQSVDELNRYAGFEY